MAFSTDPDPLNRTRTRRLLFPTSTAWSFSYRSIEEVTCGAVRAVKACSRRDRRRPGSCVVASWVLAGRGSDCAVSGAVNLTVGDFLFSRVVGAGDGTGIVMGSFLGMACAPINAVFCLFW